MATSFGRREAVGFAWALIAVGWAAFILLGPLALFLTWYGDCFSESCPSPTALDGAIYRLDAIAVPVIAVIGLVGYVRPRRAWFVVISGFGVAIVGQAVAGVLGYRGLYAFSLLLPVGVLMTVGGVAGVRALADRPLPGMGGPAAMAAGVGCAAFAIPLVALLVVPSIVFADSPVPLVATVVIAVVVMVGILARRRRSGDSTRTDHDAGVPGEGG